MDITGRVVSKIGWHWMSRFSSKTLAFQKSQQDIEWIYCSVSGLVILKMVCFSCFSCFSCVIPFQQRGWFQADKNGASEPRNLSKKNEKFRGRWLWPASAPVNFKKSSYQCWQTHKPRSSVPWSMRTQHPCWKIDCHLIILLFKTWPFRFFGCHRFLKAKFGAWKLLLRAWNIYGKPQSGGFNMLGAVPDGTLTYLAWSLFEFVDHVNYHLVMTNSSPWKPSPCD